MAGYSKVMYDFNEYNIKIFLLELPWIMYHIYYDLFVLYLIYAM